jgi:mannose-1-phosphate guanylyltransferase
MTNHNHTWALVLAAGEGRRLHTLTTTAEGVAIPKQFCSLYGGPSLFEETTRRASHVASTELVCSIVAEQHRQWWEHSTRHLPEGNVIVQPENRGTAHGILFSLMHIMIRDPNAIVVVLPADHYVKEERILAESVRATTALARASSRTGVYLLGIEPDEADSELGYVVPGSRVRDGSSKVSQFVEKPPSERARLLIDQGALWNALIIVASISALVKLFEKRFTSTILDMLTIARRGGCKALAASAAKRLYQRLPTIDFSRDILEEHTQRLRVVAVANCGWTDLGTPRRVAQILQQLPPGVVASQSESETPMQMNLAAAHMRLQQPGFQPAIHRQ